MSVWPQNEKIGVLEPLNALQVVVTLENICLIPCLVIYSCIVSLPRWTQITFDLLVLILFIPSHILHFTLDRILRHNGLQLPPDAHSKLYQSLSSFSPYNSRRVLSFSSKDFGEEFDTLADVGYDSNSLIFLLFSQNSLMTISFWPFKQERQHSIIVDLLLYISAQKMLRDK